MERQMRNAMKPSKREQTIECIEALDEGMERLMTRDIWQDRLVWWLCKAVKLLLDEQLKHI